MIKRFLIAAALIMMSAAAGGVTAVLSVPQAICFVIVMLLSVLTLPFWGPLFPGDYLAFTQSRLVRALPSRLWSYLMSKVPDSAFFEGNYDASMLGDPEEGDYHHHHSGDAEEGDDFEGEFDEGDDPIYTTGDLFAGDIKSSPIGKFIVGARNAQKKGRKLSAKAKEKLASIKANPGSFISGKFLSPLIVNNCVINITPTRTMMPGQQLVDTIVRSESQFNGTTRTQSSYISGGGATTVTFAAPVAAENGNIKYAPAVIVVISVKTLSAIAQAEVRITMSGKDESSNDISAGTWSIMLPQNGKAATAILVPYTEIATTVYPRIVQGNVANNLVVSFQGLPPDVYLRVYMPGSDSMQWQYIKEGFGITKLPTALARYLKQ